MVQTTEKSSDHRSKVDAAVTALGNFIRDLCPDAQLEISFARYEDEDGHIWVSLPSALRAHEREALANRVAEKSIDILLTDGVLVLAGIDDADMRDTLGTPLE